MILTLAGPISGASAARGEEGPAAAGVGTWEKSRGMFIRGQSLRIGLAAHGASDVPVSAFAVNPTVHSRFSGTYENIDVFFRLLGAAGAHR